VGNDTRRSGRIELDEICNQPSAALTRSLKHDSLRPARERVSLKIFDYHFTRPSWSPFCIKSSDSKHVRPAQARRAECTKLGGNEAGTDAEVAVAVCPRLAANNCDQREREEERFSAYISWQ